MAEYAAALEAFKRVAALAVEHHAALDAAARLMHSHTWVGGGAPAFTADLSGHRTRLQSALSTATRALADAVVRQGGPTLPAPTVTTSPTGAAAPAGAFQGIDPRAMTSLISTLDHAAHTLPPAGARLGAELAAHGLSSYPGHTLGHVAGWALESGQDLRQRLSRIQRAVPWATLPAGLAAYDLFGAHAPGSGQTEQFLRRVAAGDAEAVRGLLAVQEGGGDAGLAARVNAWWHTTNQDTLLNLPGFGSLNGLPAIARDRANRRWLSAEKARLTDALNRGVAELVELRDPLLIGGWERIASHLRRIEYIEQKIAPVEGYPLPLLLAFDVAGQGRLIVSWGNPDTADVTVTNVSGLTSGLDAAHGDLERARALWRQADATSGDKTVASITWLGYDAPQIDPGLFDPAKSVAFEGAAAKGGEELARFADGLRASHEPSRTARRVVIGHSYGSLTTGHAATLRPGQFADVLVFVGSPGVGVRHARELGVDPGHVWVGEAGGDPVAALGSFGADPGDASFGARRFPVGREVYTAAHSCYWDADSASLSNMGRLINGQYDQITPPPVRGDQPQLLMPEIDPNFASRSNR
ncbi:alpha/beta hydrolase [Nonomuraea sp. NPDC050790]|uniref:alpha/beta hydrolase n=1 Tax=Nonomuraea sp. NPDC050790 TaxID=3364371 RepID=UPI0037B45E45